MAGGDDHSTDGIALLHRDFGGRRRGDADIPHIMPGRGQGRRHGIQDHGAADPAVPAYDDGTGGQPGPEGGGPACNRDGVETVTYHPTNSGNTDSQRHTGFLSARFTLHTGRSTECH